MKSVSLTLVLGLIVSLISCSTSSSSKVSKLATDMCDCFSAAESKLDAETTQLFKNVAASDTPARMLQEEMKKLTPEKSKVVTEIIAMIGDTNSSVSKCLADFDKQHPESKSTDRKQMALEIVGEMRKQQCVVGTVVIYMGTKAL